MAKGLLPHNAFISTMISQSMRELPRSFYERLAFVVSVLFSIFLVTGIFWILWDTSCFASPEQREMRDVLIPGILGAGAVVVAFLFAAAKYLPSKKTAYYGLVLLIVLGIGAWLYSVFPLTTCVT